jgi:hypothetical protein
LPKVKLGDPRDNERTQIPPKPANKSEQSKPPVSIKVSPKQTDNAEKNDSDSPKPLKLDSQQLSIIRDQFQIPKEATVSITDTNNDNKLSKGDIVTTKLDGKTYKATIKDTDVQQFKNIAEADALRDDFQKNKAKWEKSGLSNYSYTLTRGSTSGGTGRFEHIPYRIGVKSGKAEEITEAGKQSYPTPSTIDEIFERIGSSLGEKGTIPDSSISVKYDKKTGHPISFSSNHHKYTVPRSYFDETIKGAIGELGDPGADGAYSYKITNLHEGHSPLAEEEKVSKTAVKNSQNDSGFYDWFKKTHGDLNNDGKIDTVDVKQWLAIVPGKSHNGDAID